MSLKTRLYLPNAPQPHLVLSDFASLGIRKSLRLKNDDLAAGFNGDGMEYIYRITASSPQQIALDLLEHYPNPADELPPTDLYIASTKGKSKDRMVKDLTPLGATRIVFYQAERSVAKPEPSQEERLQKIAIEACRQCGRSTIPAVIIHARPLAALFNQTSLAHPPILFCEKGEHLLPDSISNAPLALIFGPEGGFTDHELQALEAYAPKIVSLGPRILRCELAVVAGMALVQRGRGLL